jgi:hypothetical protein
MRTCKRGMATAALPGRDKISHCRDYYYYSIAVYHRRPSNACTDYGLGVYNYYCGVLATVRVEIRSKSDVAGVSTEVWIFNI